MKTRILIGIINLIAILTLVLSLHIIETCEEHLWYSSEIVYNNVTIREFYNKDPEWFGIEVNINFIYDIVLYSIIGLIFTEIILLWKIGRVIKNE